MKSLRLSIAIMTISLGAHGAGIPVPGSSERESRTSALAGKWWVIQGDLRDEGFYFDPQDTRRCGEADFGQIDLGQKANFEPRGRPGKRSAPWNTYERYRFDNNGMLTLKSSRGPDVRCFLKFEALRRRGVGPERQVLKPYVCVFYEPGQPSRAFKLFRRDEIGRLATDEATGAGPVFVPFEDVLTGKWIILPGRLAANGKLEFQLKPPAPTELVLLDVGIDNVVELRAGGRSGRFRLRQYDPTHWAILYTSGTAGEKGTLILERKAGHVIGGNVLLTRWQVGGQVMTAVLLAEGSRSSPNVPSAQFENAQPLNLEPLLLLDDAATLRR